MAFTFPAMVAWDPNGKLAVKNVSFQVYATTDTAFTTALAITDPFGTPLPGNILNSGSQGVFPQFQQASNSTVVIADSTKTYAWTVVSVSSDAATASFVSGTGSTPGAIDTLVGQKINTAGSSSALAVKSEVTTGATSTALNATYVPLTQKGAASGVATLDSGSKIPSSQIPDLSGTYAMNARSSSPVGGQDRQLMAPGVLIFSPQFVQGSNPGEYVGVVCIKTGANYKITSVWSDDDLATVILSDDILATAGTDFFDPFIIKLPNGDIIVGFHSSAGLYFYKSIDGGRTWTATSTLASTASNAYSEVCIIRLRQPGTGTAVRLVCCFTDVDPTKARDTVVRTMFSDNETTTWSASTVATPASGTSSCAQLSDNLRAWIFEDLNGNVQLLYSRKATGSPAEVWAESLNNVGQAPSGAPVKVTVATLATSTTGQPQNGVSPCAVRGRGGKYILFYSAANYGSGGSSGELHMIVGDGTKAGWTGTDTIIASTTTAPNGYGRITPQRLSGGARLEGLYVYVSSSTVSTLRSVHVMNG